MAGNVLSLDAEGETVMIPPEIMKHSICQQECMMIIYQLNFSISLRARLYRKVHAPEWDISLIGEPKSKISNSFG